MEVLLMEVSRLKLRAEAELAVLLPPRGRSPVERELRRR